MSQTKRAARTNGDAVDLGDLPDARVTIDLRETAGGWEAFDPDDETSIVGHAETAPRAAADYCRRVAEFLEDNRPR